MAANLQLDNTVFALSRFQTCTADLRHAVACLQAIEEEMAEAVQEMYHQNETSERLCIAEDMLADLRAALRELGCLRTPQPGA
jgi:hypothetical protein